MARFLTTKEVDTNRNDKAKSERVIRGAQERLVLKSPYLKLHQLVVERLGDAARRGVEIRLVCREGDLKDAQRAQLMALPRVQLFFMEHLHAKCYANERRLVLTSMNLYDASGKIREMGVSCEVGQELYRDAMAEAESIINNASPFHGAVRTRAGHISAACGEACEPACRGTSSGDSDVRCERAACGAQGRVVFFGGAQGDEGARLLCALSLLH